MAIAKRYTSLNTDTKISTADFGSATNEGTLNTPSSSAVGVKLDSVENAVGNSLPSPYTKPLAGKMSGRLANIVKPNSLLDAIAVDLTSVQGITRIISGKTTNNIHKHTLNIYRKIGGTGNPSTFTNKMKSGTTFGEFLQEECEGDLDNLLGALKSMGVDLTAPKDPDAILAMLLALLARLICNDITNAFVSLLELLTNIDLRGRFGAGGIGLAAALSKPDLILEIAGSNVGEFVQGFLPAIVGMSMTSLIGYETGDKKNTNEFFTAFNGALTILDPSWGGVDGSAAGKNGQSPLGDIARAVLSGGGDNSDSAVGTAISLMAGDSNPLATLARRSIGIA